MHSTQEIATEPPRAPTGHAWHGGVQRRQVKLTFGELVLIFKALQAVKTLDALPRQDELLDDTIDLVDRVLAAAVRESP
jgi:hypothetical protein